jgi:hypothetical protein
MFRGWTIMRVAGVPAGMDAAAVMKLHAVGYRAAEKLPAEPVGVAVLRLGHTAVRGARPGKQPAGSQLRMSRSKDCQVEQCSSSERGRFLGRPVATRGEARFTSVMSVSLLGAARAVAVPGRPRARPRRSPRLSTELLAAGRSHQVLLLPGTGHRVTQEDLAARLLHLQLDLLRKALPASDPPSPASSRRVRVASPRTGCAGGDGVGRVRNDGRTCRTVSARASVRCRRRLPGARR